VAAEWDIGAVCCIPEAGEDEMRRVMVSTVVLLVAAVVGPGSRHACGMGDGCCGLAACKGETPCKVCTDCTRCRHCREGGTCGACKPDVSSLSPAVVALLVGVQPPPEARPKGKPKPGKKVAAPLLQAGSEVTLTLSGDESAGDPTGIVLAVFRFATPGDDTRHTGIDDDTHNLLLKATRIGDRAGVDGLLAEGRAVRLTEGTRLIVTHRYMRYDPVRPGRVVGGDPDCRARIVAGEHKGKVVEVPVRNLR
jgi:hypothetical protein